MTKLSPEWPINRHPELVPRVSSVQNSLNLQIPNQVWNDKIQSGMTNHRQPGTLFQGLFIQIDFDTTF